MTEPHAVNGIVQDLSESGVRILIEGCPEIPEQAHIFIDGSFGVDVRVEGRRVREQSGKNGSLEVAFEFVQVDEEQYRRLVQLMFSDDQSWVENDYPKDRVLRSLWSLCTTYWRVSGAQHE